MYTEIDPENCIPWDIYFLEQAQQNGHGLDGFAGVPYQRGYGIGNIFRGLFRMLLPLVKTAGKTIGKEALFTGTNIASDMLAGQDIETSAKNRGREAATRLVNKAQSRLEQTGEGTRKRKWASKKSDKVKELKKSVSHKKSGKKSRLLKQDIFGLIN
jgi:hypothetical protein